MTTKILKSDEARQSWRDVLDSVTTGDQVVIERYNKPVAALISYADFLALHEELEDLRAARRAEAAYAAWQEDPARARAWEDIEAELIAEGRLDGARNGSSDG